MGTLLSVKIPQPTLVRAVGSRCRLEAGAAAVVDLHLLLAAPADPRELAAADHLRLLVAASGPVVAIAHPDDAGAGDREAAARLRLAGWPARSERSLAGMDLAAVARSSWPKRDALRAAGFVGSSWPLLVLVGDREAVPRGIPFLCRSGAWLIGALRALGHDPLAVALGNARLPNGEANPHLGAALGALLASRPRPTVVALGEEAAEALEDLGCGHARAPHPAWHRRFRHEEGPEGYARLLEAGGAPAGPYRARGRVVAPAGGDRAWELRRLGDGWLPRAYAVLLSGGAALA